MQIFPGHDLEQVMDYPVMEGTGLGAGFSQPQKGEEQNFGRFICYNVCQQLPAGNGGVGFGKQFAGADMSEILLPPQ